MKKLLTTAIGSLFLLGGNAQADFVINDDLIVDGSACIGFDCVNGHSFGFDTIVLRENNLRIKFDDTSTASSFPRNDWQITANDSANGGASKFSIDDISGSRTPFTIEANARSHSLYVDDGGRIGIRTSTPSTEIHVIDGDSPTLRLQQDGSSGFAPQTWDLAGNETNFFIRDVTNGSQLPFRIRPDAPTSSIDIASDGNVGIGTASPEEKLHIVDSPQAKIVQQYGASAANDKWTWNAQATDMRLTRAGTPLEFKIFAADGGANSGNLEIQGSFVSNGTALNVPDYVFEPSYKLMPLDDLSEFIEKKKHLPNIPSAMEIKEKGLNMTQLQLSILEKVEELTLYTVQQEETIRELKAKIAQLESTGNQ